MLRCAGLFLLLLIAGCAAGTANVKIENPDVDMTNSLNRLSYAAGYQLGDMFQNQKLSLSADAVLKGMYDARKNIRPVLTKSEMKIILRNPKKFLVEDSDNDSRNALQEGQAFLQTNAQRDGVVILESGLQYRVLREGDGRTPKVTDRVKLNYSGKKIDGSVFVSTDKNSQSKEVAVQTLVPGMMEGLQMMKEGSTWEFYIPTLLAYADHGPMAAQTLIFEVELLEVLPAE